MILDIFNKEICLFRLGRNEQYGWSFIFDIGLIPQQPKPKRLVFQYGGGKRIRQWSMSWRKFMKQTCIGTVVRIERTEFKYSIISGISAVKKKGHNSRAL